MKKYEVLYTITGRVAATIEAKDLKAAKEKAKWFDLVENSDEIIEWSFEEVEQVTLLDDV